MLLKQAFHKTRKLFIRLERSFSTNPRALLQRLIFILVFILFPANLAKHFVTPSSYVLGVLVDYLSPALYLTEILVFLLLITSSWKKPVGEHRIFLLLLTLFLFSLLPSVFLSDLRVVSLVRFLEISLWLIFSYWVSQNVSWSRRREVFLLVGAGVLWSFLLALTQFILQRNIFGYWFLGEPTIYPSLAGVAKTSFLGADVLRPYATFPHPNVLGGVASVVFLWVLSTRLWGLAVSGFFGTLISFSRTAFVSLSLGFLGFLILTRKMALFLMGYQTFFGDLSVSRRVDLLKSAFSMFKSAPFWGVGLSTFTRHLPEFGVPSGLTLFIQPVHNIFALVAAESGGFALLSFLLLFAFAFWTTVKRKQRLLAVSLSQIVLLGLFDHYFLTSPQGLFLLSLTLGLSFSYSQG